jgi:SAM-dependent methyltransferase
MLAIMTPDTLPSSPAAERNKAPILEVLQRLLPPTARVLEIASGTGQHAAHFAASQPDWRWQPTEGDAEALPAIAARCAGLPNVLPPLQLDVLAASWPTTFDRFDAIYCANMLHISPWPTCEALMRGASRHLVEGGGLLIVYGPFIVDGEPTAPSNLAFDASLRARDPAWGLRLLAEVEAEAHRAGLALQRRFDMPANNLALAFGRSA